jgi:hypothetical protein
MNLANKSVKNNLTGEVFTVIDSFEDIAILEGNQKAKVSNLLNTSLYTEEIDPKSFFNNQGAYNILAEKIKSIPQELINDSESGEISVNLDGNSITPTTNSLTSTDESAIIVSSVEDERAELARKYGITSPPVEQLNKQNEAFARILGEGSENELPQVQQYNEPEGPVTRVEASRDTVNREYIQPIKQEDPIVKMFKGVKRIIDFKVSLDINNKIPRLDFIEMMEDSYETSIIDFLADEFTNNLLNNPEVIKDMIKSKINILVYGEDKSVINDQITDSVTQVNTQITDSVTIKKKPTPKPQVIREGEKPKRTPRAKKEVVK